MFTKDELKTFRTDFKEAIKDLEKKYNVSIGIANITYSDLEFHTKMTVTRQGKAGESSNQLLFEKECFYLGLDKSYYGKMFELNGKIFEVSGINLRARKMPILAKCSDGKSYKFSVESVKRLVK